MKIALIHDHLVQIGGAERVLKVFSDLYPDAPIYTLIYDESRFHDFIDRSRIRTSFLQSVPFSKSRYQWLLPLMTTATELHDLSKFDVVLSSSSAFSKGVITKSTTMHICYCHTPTRYLWTDSHAYTNDLKIPGLIKKGVPFLLSQLRLWDQLAANRVDHFIANSKTVQERIMKYYRRTSDSIYPPVALDKFYISEKVDNYFLAGGRLVSYKKFDMICEAFNNLGLPLKIFGIGPEQQKLRRISRKKNIEFLGAVTDAQRADLYSKCIAYIHPQEEDFGITAIEAMASGRPVIALAAGGALETIVDGLTGTFFYDQDWPALADAVIRFDATKYNPEKIRRHAMQFSVDRFKKEITGYVDRALERWQDVQHMKRLRETKRLF
ncbi:glycosyltransferase [Candidatus Uhrbacteria bacterium]|nr:glycosyltransferase [Candidatus Uhrbacteria bacterium]